MSCASLSDMLGKFCEWDRYFAHKGLTHKLSAAWLRWAWEFVFYMKSITGFAAFASVFWIMERIKSSLWRILLNSCFVKEYELIWSILFQRLACAESAINYWVGQNVYSDFSLRCLWKNLKEFFPKPILSYLSFCVVNMTSLKLLVVLKKRLKKFRDEVGSMWFMISLKPVIWNKTSEQKKHFPHF